MRQEHGRRLFLAQSSFVLLCFALSIKVVHKESVCIDGTAERPSCPSQFLPCCDGKFEHPIIHPQATAKAGIARIGQSKDVPVAVSFILGDMLTLTSRSATLQIAKPIGPLRDNTLGLSIPLATKLVGGNTIPSSILIVGSFH